MAQAPPAGQAGEQTYLIECNRANSKIDADTPQGQNSRWTTQCDFQLKRGDRVSVEMAVIEAGQSATNQTIEFTRETVKGKGYADNKVVFEFGFYINNNSRYNTLAPFRVKHSYGNTVWGQNGNMQVCPVNSTQVPPLQQHIPAASLGFSFNQGQQYDFFYAIDAVGNAENTIAQPVWTGGTKNGKIKYIVISQLNQSILATTPQNGRYNRTVNDYYPPIVPLCNYTAQDPTLGGTVAVPPEQNGWVQEGNNFEITVGMGVAMSKDTGDNQPAGSGALNERRCLGVVSNILSGSDNVPAIVAAKAYLAGLGTPVDIAGNLIIELREEYTVVATDAFQPHSGVIGYTKLGGWSANQGKADSKATPDLVATQGAELSSWDRIAKAGMNMGMQNWSAGVVKPPKSGSLNLSDFNIANGVNAEPAPKSVHYQQKMFQNNLMRKLGGGVGWEVMRTATDQLLMQPQECSAQIGNQVSSSSEGIETMNMMNFKDNEPYILVCPSYQGCQVNPNGTGLCPDLVPMTAFVVVSADQTFEDVNFLAERITEAFHAVNPFSNTTGKGSLTNEKKNNCLPYYHDGWFPTYWTNTSNPSVPAVNPIPQPPVAPNLVGPNIDSNVEPMGGKQISLYAGISPLWSGNLVKCIPCNCTLGPNFSSQVGAPYYWTPNADTDYLSSGGADAEAKNRGTTHWWKGIFGNCGVKNLSKQMAGDRLNKHCETWCLNNFSVDPATNEVWDKVDCGRIVVLNTQLPRVRVTAQSQKKNLATEVFDPLYPNGFPFAFNGAVMKKGQAIMTNLYYNENNVKLLAEFFKLTEKYDTDAPDAVSGYEAQQAQPWNWYAEIDLGQADSSKQVRDKFGYIQKWTNTDYSQGAAPVINFNFVDNNIQVPQYLLDVVSGFWQEQTPPMSKCAPHPSSFQSSRIISGANANSAVASGEQNNEINVSVAATNNRSMICPAQCTVGNGFGTSYQEAKKTGIIRVHSRWWNELDTNPALPDFSLEAANQVNVLGSLDSMKNYAKKDGQWAIDPQLSRDTACGGVPYIYYPRDAYSTTAIKYFMCFMVYKDYEPKNNDIATWELNQFGWGDYFGFSPSPYDNPVLIPTNADAMNLTSTLNFQQVAPAVAGPVTTIAADAKQRWNRNNYQWIGAGDAVCAFDNVANRFKIGGLYTETRLPKLDISGNTIAATPQIGEQEIILGADTVSSKQDIWEDMEDAFPLTGLDGNNTTLPIPYSGVVLPDYSKPPTTWFANGGVVTGADAAIGADPRETFDRKDQNINDVQTGVFLHKVWLAPEGWQPPQGIDLQNYYDPRMDMVEDPTVDMGNAPSNVGGETTVNGTKVVDRTKQNKALITENLIEASPENWEGCLLDKMGFNYYDLIPPYGEQSNRFSEFTYGRDDLALMYKGVKPLIQNTQADSAANISMSVYASLTPADTQGTPLFSQGFLNNETINIGGLNVGNVTASRFPTLFSCPFYSIVSNIVETQFQSSDQAKNVVWLGMKNYGAGQYYYISASDYAQVVDEDRLLTEVSTEIRNPNTGRLAQLSPNSCIIYKIQRNIFVPTPEIDANGQDLFAPPVQGGDEIGQHLHENLGSYSPEELRELAREDVRITSRVLTEGANAVDGDAPRAIIDTLELQGDRLLRQTAAVARAEIEEAARGAPELDRERLMAGVSKLAVSKALQNMRVVADGRNLLNPFIMSNEINKEWARIAERFAVLEGRDEPLTVEEMLRELRSDDVDLGRDGQIVRGRRRGRRGELQGQYDFSPDLVEKVARILRGEGRDQLRRALQEAIANREIEYIPPADGSPSQMLSTEELYQRRQMGITEARAREQERRNLKKGGTRQQRSRARALARQEINELIDGGGYDTETINLMRLREFERADKDPVAYIQSVEAKQGTDGGGDGGGDGRPRLPPPRPMGIRMDSAAQRERDREAAYDRQFADDSLVDVLAGINLQARGGRKPNAEDARREALNSLLDERAAEQRRGDIVKKRKED